MVVKIKNIKAIKLRFLFRWGASGVHHYLAYAFDTAVIMQSENYEGISGESQIKHKIIVCWMNTTDMSKKGILLI